MAGVLLDLAYKMNLPKKDPCMVFFPSGTTVGLFARTDTSCKVYIVMTASGFTTSRKVAAANPGIYRIVTFTATTRITLVHPSTRKASVNVETLITWWVSTKEVVTGCTASRSLSVAVCTTDAKWPIGGEGSTERVGSSVILQHTTLLGCGGITIKVTTIRYIYWRKQNAVQPLRQIRTSHQLVKKSTGGAF